MQKPVFKRTLVSITGTPDPDLEVERRAVKMFRALEATLHRHFNNHTTLNQVRGIMEGLGAEVPGMPPRAKDKLSDAQKEGYELARAIVLASELMGEFGPRYIARVAELMQPVVATRVEWQAKTAEWERTCRRQP